MDNNRVTRGMFTNLQLTNKALSTCLNHWGSNRVVADRISEAVRVEQSYIDTLKSMNSDTILYAATLISKADIERSMGRVIMRVPPATTVLSITHYLGVHRISADGVIRFLTMNGFGYAESGGDDARGFVAWDHGVAALCRLSKFGLRMHMPVPGSSTDALWGLPARSDEDYRDSICADESNHYMLNAWREVVVETAVNPHESFMSR